MIPTSNNVENTPMDALIADLADRGYRASWVVTDTGDYAVRCNWYDCIIDRDTLEDCTEIAWPFRKPLNELSLAITQVAHRGCRPAHPKYVMSKRGKWLTKSIISATLHGNNADYQEQK